MSHEIEYESEIDDTLLIQADEDIIYSPGSANPPSQQSPVLSDPEAGSFSIHKLPAPLGDSDILLIAELISLLSSAPVWYSSLRL